MSRARTDQEVLAVMAAKSTRQPSGCIFWSGSLDKHGYGQITYKAKNMRAHRLAYLLNKGPLIDGKVIMHSCDNRACINPDHLSQADSVDNTRDRHLKGRTNVARGDAHYMRRNRHVRAGEKCPTAKLTTSDVLSIRDFLSRGMPQSALARQFSVSRTCISAIATRRIWNHI